jgi:hypothetical protein
VPQPARRPVKGERSEAEKRRTLDGPPAQRRLGLRSQETFLIASAYAYHRPKLELVRHGVLDDKRPGDTRFAPLADFLESIPTTCPHDLFRRDEDPKGRASQAKPAFADSSRIIVNRKENAATHTAALIIPAVGHNKLRHETLQRFMLANDSVTVAIEVPIWLTEEDTVRTRAKRGLFISVGFVSFPFSPKWAELRSPLTGRRAGWGTATKRWGRVVMSSEIA